MIEINDYPTLRGVVRFFEEISVIPRGSGNREPIADYLVRFAKERGFEYYRDQASNVIIKKAATPGYENKPTVILQGHTDMVLAKNEKCAHDLEVEGVKLYRDGDLLRAVGTTLGGDDGVAVAYALAILDSDKYSHPQLEAVFTSDEEIGLLGAVALDATKLSGNTLINIDSDLEGIFTVGCAGGVRCDVDFHGDVTEKCEFAYSITLEGLHGGHSGAEINSGYLNANKLAFELLSLLSEKVDFRIANVFGGNADNAIPRFCSVEIGADTDIVEKIDTCAKALTEKYLNAEPEMTVTVNKTAPAVAISSSDTKRLIGLISALPNGVMKMSEDIEGLVETSLNLGVIRKDGNNIRITFSTRSSKGKEKSALCQRLKDIAENYGAEYSEHGSYPAWEYRKDSPLRDRMVKLYREKYGKEPKVVAIHAGLECGIFAEKIENLDCVSIGPDNFDIHTTEERLSLSSTARVFEFLTNLLKTI